MGIYGMMRTGVSGMNAQANRLTGVADNVANVSTAGYKRTDTQFSSLVMPSTKSAYQSGGVLTTVRHDISVEGSGRATGKAGDIMIQGNGFFRVQDESGSEYLTRAGSFQRTGDGYLQNAAGFYLLDEMGNRVIIKGGAGELIPGHATENINLTTNLKSDEVAIDRSKVPFSSTDSKSYHQKKSVTVYDEQGTAVVLDFYYTKTKDNTWEMQIYTLTKGDTPDKSVYLGLLNQTLTFDQYGKLTSPSGSLQINVPNLNKVVSGQVTFPVKVNFPTDTVTQLGANFSFGTTQDGYAPGSFQNFTFSEKGEIQVHYSNNQTKVIGLVGVSTVTAPDRLIPITGTAFQVTPDAGAQTFGHPGEGIFGTLKSGLLEESNADIGNELTDMIEAQRNYTANSKVFQTGSEVLDVILSLKR
ncbi:flagellar hook protein FlgE [uncultured Bartonella sp.]|uniref:flagellar hook protein FlgE n=1 Tax=uncultured Bartonella sp. TaxID=104108 RepID=UPI002634E403|nr:flagellar hook protein FlgE [uncultured Bartonella sp.]